MKLRTLLLATLVLPMSVASALADEIRTDLDLQEVTVNPRGAQLVRTGEVKLPAGSHEVVLDTLPRGINPASVQVEGRADGSAEIGTVDVSAIALDPAEENSAERQALQDELDALNRDRARQERTIQDAQFRRQTLERLTGGFGAVPFANGDKPSMSPEQIKNLLQLTNTELSEISAVVLDGQLALEKISKREKVVQDKLALLANAPRARTRVVVQVSAEQATTMQLSVKYTVANAGWRPVYDARLALPVNGKKAGLELVQRALVFQRTGEAWDEVALKLSTAAVTGRTSAPVLTPVAIGQQPERRELSGAYLSDAQESVAAPQVQQNLRKRAGAALKQREAEVVNAGFHAVYTIAGATSVANNGAMKSVRIGSKSVTPEIRIDTTPQFDTTGYLTGVFKIDGETPLLGGEVSLFRDGVFAGKANMKQIAPGEEAELGFGRDDLVRVVRRELENKSGSSGIITEQNTLKRLHVTTVENLHDFPVKVHMVQRMPYSTHEEIKVDMSEETTKPTLYEPDNKKGIAVWDIDLAPGKSGEVKFGYSIEHPKDMPVHIPE